MLLKDACGPNRLIIRVTGYQFPDAPDVDRRLSWHMVSREASCEQGSWQVHWQGDDGRSRIFHPAGWPYVAGSGSRQR